ncbi:PAS domain S-box protein [Candidatus Acetothermia bacterium]|nr:PAS domain S-box protein [Candidatus Acetothermia bacterium]MBI3643135.1 PAS domain S-box protein [Candidatus Acetothermia bacterium]
MRRFLSRHKALLVGSLGWILNAMRIGLDIALYGSPQFITSFLDDPVAHFALLTTIPLFMWIGRLLRQSEHAHETEAKFRLAFNASPAAISIATLAEGRYVEVNDSFCRISGYMRDEVIGHTRGELRLWADPTERDRLIAILETESRVQDYEFRVRRKGGEIIVMRTSAEQIEIAGTRCVLAINYDVTEQVRAQEILKRHNEYLAILHKTTLGLINRLDLNELLEDILSRACELAETNHGYLYLVEPDSNTLKVRFGTGMYAKFLGYRISMGEGLAGKVWQSGEPIVLGDYQSWTGRDPNPQFDDLHALVGIPLRLGSQIVGVIGLSYLDAGRTFSAEVIPILNQLAELASLALGNAEIYTSLQTELVERRHAEESLRFSAQILSRINSLVLVGDQNGLITYVSPSVRDMLGYEPEELLGDGWWTLSRQDDPDDRKREKKYVARVVRGEIPLNEESHEHLIFTKQGEPRWILFADAMGDREFLIGVGYDITERKNLELQLQESEMRYRDLFENANDAIYTLDREGIFTSFNHKAEELTGFSSHEVLGQPYSVLLPTEEHSRASNSFVRNLKGEPVTFELVIQRKDGSQKVLEFSTRPIWRGSEIIGNQGIARDITARKELDRMKKDFISLVSHELRTPLTSIKGYTDVLYNGDAGPLTPEQREFLEIISQNATRLTHLINELLDIEQMESQQIKLEKQEIQLIYILQEVCKTFQINAKEKGLHLSSNLQGALRVNANADRLTQLFANLVSNAIKYTPSGSIAVRAYPSTEGQEAVVEIEDTGIGISPEDFGRLFEKFYRAANEYTRKAGGTGLGLAIAKTIVDQHAGTITVQSRLGQGSIFMVRLPLAPEREMSR